MKNELLIKISIINRKNVYQRENLLKIFFNNNLI